MTDPVLCLVFINLLGCGWFHLRHKHKEGREKEKGNSGKYHQNKIDSKDRQLQPIPKYPTHITRITSLSSTV